MEERDSLLLLDKSFESLMNESLADLEGTVISNTGPGGVARLLLSVVNKHFSEFYKSLKVEHTRAFLSKAKDGDVDAIGEMLNCTRLQGESDDDYKYRISQQSLTLERANETAVRLAILSNPIVVDVIMKEYTHGTGSFAVYPILNNPYDFNVTLLEDLKSRIKEAKAYGMRAVVLEPRLSFVEMKGRLVFNKKVSEIDRALIQNEATQAVRRYINALMPGEGISINQVHSLVMATNENIMGIEIYHFMINRKSMLVVDQEPSWNERYIEAQIPSAIVFS